MNNKFDLCSSSPVLLQLQKTMEEVQQVNSAQVLALKKSFELSKRIYETIPTTNFNSAYSVHLGSLNQHTEVLQNAITSFNSAYQLNSIVANIFSNSLNTKMEEIVLNFGSAQKQVNRIMSTINIPVNTFESLQDLGIQKMPLNEFTEFVNNDLKDFTQKIEQAKNRSIPNRKQARKRLIARTRKLINDKEFQGKLAFYGGLHAFLCQLDTQVFGEYTKHIYLILISLIAWFAKQKDDIN